MMHRTVLCHRFPARPLRAARASSTAPASGWPTTSRPASSTRTTSCTARDGIPSWLLLVDGLIDGDPQSAGMLGRREPLQRVCRRLRRRSAARAAPVRACVRLRAARDVHRACRRCASRSTGPFEPFQAEVAKVGAKDVAMLYVLATAWAGRIQVNSGDWKAIADMPKVQALLGASSRSIRHYETASLPVSRRDAIDASGVARRQARGGQGRFREGACTFRRQEPDGAGALRASSTRASCSTRSCTTSCSTR